MSDTESSPAWARNQQSLNSSTHDDFWIQVRWRIRSYVRSSDRGLGLAESQILTPQIEEAGKEPSLQILVRPEATIASVVRLWCKAGDRNLQDYR